MSSVESAPKSILQSSESKAASKCDTVRKPVQVLNFVKGSFKGLLSEYFEEEDIGNVFTLKEEVSDDTEPHKKFSHNTDVCIVFSSKNLPLSWFDAESYANLEKLRAKSNLKIIPIEVELKSSPADYMRKIINAVKEAYSKKGEDPAITELKSECANNVLVVLGEWGTELNEPLKRAAFRDLITLYAAINNANPETILEYYQAYQEGLDNLKDFLKEEKRKHFYGENFQNIIQFSAFVSELEAVINEEKKYVWEQFIANIKQHYFEELTQQASGLAPEDSERVDEIAGRTAVVMTLVEVPDEEMEEMGGSGEEANNISSSTPFWFVQPVQLAQPADNTAAERRPGHAILH